MKNVLGLVSILCLSLLLAANAGAVPFNDIFHPTASWSFDDENNALQTSYENTFPVFDGVVDKGIYLNGRNSYVSVEDADPLDLSEEGTIRVWLNYRTIKNYDGIVHKGERSDWNDESYSLQFWNGRKLIGVLRNETGEYQTIESPSKIKRNKWYHVAYRWDEDELSLSLDGEVVAREPNTVGKALVSESRLFMGCQLENQYCPWGKLDEVALWNRSLSDDEVRIDYEQTTDDVADVLEPVSPVVECVNHNDDGTYTAYLGYLNQNEIPLLIETSENNRLTPAIEAQKQLPEVFKSGRYRNASCFTFEEDKQYVWTLTGPDGSKKTATTSTAPSQACQEVPFRCPDQTSDTGNVSDGNGEYLGVIGFFQQILQKIGLIEKQVDSIEQNVSDIRDSAANISVSLNETTSSLDSLENTTRDINTSIISLNESIKDVRDEQNNTTSQITEIGEDVKTLLNASNQTNITHNVSVNLSINSTSDENVTEQLDSTNRSVNLTNQKIDQMRGDISTQLAVQMQMFQELFNQSHQQMQSGFDALSQVVVRERKTLQENMTQGFDDVNERLERIETFHIPRIYSYLDEINQTTSLTYQRTRRLNVTVQNKLGALHQNISTILADVKNAPANVTLNRTRLANIIKNATDDSFSSHADGLENSLSSIASQLDSVQVSQNTSQEKVLASLAELETQLRLVNRTVIHTIKTESDDTQAILREHRTITDSVLTDITSLSKQMHDIQHQLNASLDEQDKLEALVYENQDQLLNLVSIVTSLNASALHNETSDTAFFEFENTIATYLKSYNESFASYREELITGIDQSQEILTALGFSDSSNETLRSLLIYLLQSNDKILSLSEEINLTTHKNQEQLEFLRESLQETSVALTESFATLLDRHSNQTKEDMEQQLVSLHEEIQTYTTTTNATLSKYQSKTVSRLETISSALETLSSSEQLTRESLQAKLLGLEEQIIAFNESVTDTIQTQHLKTRSELQEYYQSGFTDVISRLDKTDETLLSLTTQAEDLENNQETILSTIDDNRNALIANTELLGSYQDSFNTTHEQIDELSQDMQSLVTRQTDLLHSIGYQNETTTLREDLFELLLNQQELLKTQQTLNITVDNVSLSETSLESIATYLEPKVTTSIDKSIAAYTTLLDNRTQQSFASLTQMIASLNESINRSQENISIQLATIRDDMRLMEQRLQQNNTSAAYQRLVEIQSTLREMNLSLHHTIRKEHNKTRQEIQTTLKENMTRVISSLDDINNELDTIRTGNQPNETLSVLLENRDKLFEFETYLDQIEKTNELQHAEEIGQISGLESLISDLDERMQDEFEQIQQNVSLAQNRSKEQTVILNRMIGAIGSLQTNQTQTHELLYEVIGMNNALIDLANEINVTTHDIKRTTDATYLMLRDELFPKIEQLDSRLKNIQQDSENTWSQLVELSQNTTRYHQELETTLAEQNIRVDNLHENISVQIQKNRGLLEEINQTTHQTLENMTRTLIPQMRDVQQQTSDITQVLEGMNTSLTTADAGLRENISTILERTKETQNYLAESFTELEMMVLEHDSTAQERTDRLFEEIDGLRAALEESGCDCALNCNNQNRCGMMGYWYYTSLQEAISNITDETQTMLETFSDNLSRTPVLAENQIEIIRSDQYQVNESVSLFIRYTNATGNPLSDADCRLTAQDPMNDTIIDNESFDTYSYGLYEFRFIPESGGRYITSIRCADKQIGYAFKVDSNNVLVPGIQDYLEAMNASIHYALGQQSQKQDSFYSSFNRTLDNIAFSLNDMNTTLRSFDGKLTGMNETDQKILDTVDETLWMMKELESVLETHQDSFATIIQNQKNEQDLDAQRYQTLLQGQYALQRDIEKINHSFENALDSRLRIVEKGINDSLAELGNRTDKGFVTLQEDLETLEANLRNDIIQATATLQRNLTATTQGLFTSISALSDQNTEEVKEKIEMNHNEVLRLSNWLETEHKLRANESEELFHLLGLLNVSLNQTEALLADHISTQHFNQTPGPEEYALLLEVTEQNTEILRQLSSLNETILSVNETVAALNHSFREVLTNQTSELKDELGELESHIIDASNRNLDNNFESLNETIHGMDESLSYAHVLLDHVLSKQDDLEKEVGSLTRLTNESFLELQSEVASLEALIQNETHDDCSSEPVTIDTLQTLAGWNGENATLAIDNTTVRTKRGEQVSRNVVSVTYEPTRQIARAQKNLIFSEPIPQTLFISVQANRTIPPGMLGVVIRSDDDQTLMRNIAPTTQWSTYALDLSNLENVTEATLEFVLNMKRGGPSYELYLSDLASSVCRVDSDPLLYQYLTRLESRLYQYQTSVSHDTRNATPTMVNESLQSMYNDLSDTIFALQDIQNAWLNQTYETVQDNLSEMQYTLANLTTQMAALDSAQAQLLDTSDTNYATLQEDLHALHGTLDRAVSLGRYNRDINDDQYETIKGLEGDLFVILQEFNTETKDESPVNSIPLQRGVNKFIVPKELGGEDIHDTLAPIIDSVSLVLYKENGSWESYNPRALFGNSLTTFKFNHQYCIMMENDAELVI